MLVKINETQWVNPSLVVFAVEYGERVELHLYGGAVVYAGKPEFEALNAQAPEPIN